MFPHILSSFPGISVEESLCILFLPVRALTLSIPGHFDRFSVRSCRPFALTSAGDKLDPLAKVIICAAHEELYDARRCHTHQLRNAKKDACEKGPRDRDRLIDTNTDHRFLQVVPRMS